MRLQVLTLLSLACAAKTAQLHFQRVQHLKLIAKVRHLSLFVTRYSCSSGKKLGRFWHAHCLGRSIGVSAFSSGCPECLQVQGTTDL